MGLAVWISVPIGIDGGRLTIVGRPPFLFDYSDILRFDMCSDCAEHFEVDEEHAFGSAFSFEEGAFVSIKESADDSDAVALFQFHFLWMEVGDVVLHFGGGVDEKFHLARGNLENLEFAVHFLVAVGDEGVLVLQRIDSAERGEDKDGVGDERTLYNLLLAMNGRVRGGHGTVCP